MSKMQYAYLVIVIGIVLMAIGVGLLALVLSGLNGPDSEYECGMNGQSVLCPSSPPPGAVTQIGVGIGIDPVTLIAVGFVHRNSRHSLAGGAKATSKAH